MASKADNSIKPRDVCIVGVARTPMGGFLGSLSSLPATKLGSIAIECALRRANVDPSLVQEVFFGNVLSANLGQAPAKQAALGAGIPNSVICTTINKVCASGMKATMIAAQTIELGTNDVVVAGGMESMSNAPKYLPQGRTGSRLGHDTIIDGMLKDGLWDVYNDIGMGVCAEICADRYNITREEQDSYAIQSFKRGIAAKTSGAFTWEIVPVEVSSGRGKPTIIVDEDEGLGKFDASRLRKLRPSFKENGGSVTAGNASSISDGDLIISIWIPSRIAMATPSVQEVLPPSLDSTSEPPPLFDGTTRLYINYHCPFAQRPWIVRNYKGLHDKIKLVPIDLENRPAWYKEKVYPPNKVPSLEHNGKVIGESLDLIKYLDNNFEGPALLPDDPDKRKFAEELLAFIDTFTQNVYGSFKGDTIKEAGAEFDYLETALQKFNDGPFFLGQFSLVDAAYAPLVERFQIFLHEVFKYDITSGRPKLGAWVKELNNLDAYKQTKCDPKYLVKVYKSRFLAQT